MDSNEISDSPLNEEASHTGYLKDLICRYMNTELQIKTECLNGNLSELSNQLKEKCSIINVLESKMKNDSEWKKYSVLQLQKCSSALENLTNLYNDVTRFVQILIKKKSQLTKRVKDIDNNISNQFTYAKEIQAENTKILEYNNELKKEVENLKLMVQTLQKENSEFKAKNEDNYKTLLNNEKVLTNLKQEKDQIALQNKSLSDSMQSLIRDLKITKENHNKQINEIEKLKNEIKEKNSKTVEVFDSRKQNENNINQNFPEAIKINEQKSDNNSGDLSDESDSNISFSNNDYEDQDNISVHKKMALLATKVRWNVKRSGNKIMENVKDRKISRVE